MAAQHQWVKHTIVPVEILPPLEDNEEFTTWCSGEAIDLAETHAVFGCAACSLPLNADTVKTDCLGSDIVNPAP